MQFGQEAMAGAGAGGGALGTSHANAMPLTADRKARSRAKTEGFMLCVFYHN